jgi:protein tyrosine phosphatase (PTP) superfamily phosphohydrolase (DUF442 family)
MAAVTVVAVNPSAHAAVAPNARVARAPLKFDRWSRLAVHVRSAEVAAIDRVEPKNMTGLEGKKPTLAHGALNLAEAIAVRLHLMRPAKTYEAWVDPGQLMRGSEQNAAGFAALQKQGIKTVINLKREDNSEAAIVEGLGMKAVHIPMYDQSLPSPKEIQAFFDVVDAPGNQPAYVHCEQGVGRTGVMVALYRIHADGLSADAAIAEAKARGMNSQEQFDYLRSFAAAETRGAAWATIRP